MGGTIDNTQTRPQSPAPVGSVGRTLRNDQDVARQYAPTDLKEEVATDEEVSSSAGLSVGDHATTNHAALPGVPAAEAFDAAAHTALDHTGQTGVPAAEAFDAAAHTALDHTGQTGVPAAEAFDAAAHTALDHTGQTGVPAAGELPIFTVGTLPAVGAAQPKMIFVSDEVGGPVPAYTDGTNWRRISDGIIVA